MTKLDDSKNTGNELDEILEKLYNSAWVEGNTYDDTLEQAGIDTEVRSKKELKRCEAAKSKLTKYIEQEIKKAQLQLLRDIKNSEGYGKMPIGMRDLLSYFSQSTNTRGESNGR
jgi:hypothetical protein